MYSQTPLYKAPTFWLSFLYLFTGIGVAARIILMLVRKYRRMSYNMFFLVLCLLTCIIRTACFMSWTLLNGDFDLLLSSLYWFPTESQFATFSLLVVFYANIVHASNWDRAKIPAWIVYSMFNALFMTAFILSLVYRAHEKIDLARSVITASTFFVLVFALGYYGFQVWQILRTENNPDPKLHGISPFKIFAATSLIMVIYLSRAIYNIVVEVFPSLSLYFGAAGEEVASEIMAAVYFAIWEIVPTLIILVLFWGTTPATRRVYRPLHALPYLNDTYSINTGDVESAQDEEFDFHLPVPAPTMTTYATSPSPSLHHGFNRDSTSLLPSTSSSYSEVTGSYESTPH